jgi:hypothetical protein
MDLTNLFSSVNTHTDQLYFSHEISTSKMLLPLCDII